MKSWNQKTNSESFSEKALQEQYLDVLFRLAFMKIEQQRTEELGQRVERDEVGIPVVEMDAMREQARPVMLRLIDKASKRAVRQRFARDTLPQIVRIAAAALLMFYIGSTVAIATVPSVRARVMQLMIQMGTEYAILSLEEDKSASLNVPDDWMGSCYPSYITKGYHLLPVENDGYKLRFEDNAGQWITFSEYDEDARAYIDVEDSEIQHFTLNGTAALMATKDGCTLMSWAEFDKYYLLRVDSGPQEAKRIAQEIRKIR